MTTITVRKIPRGPTTRRSTAASMATLRMMSAMIGQAIQNESEGSPLSQ